ncbi:lantibiotic immunity ABC transporter MutG family permease subunit [Paenibacillus xylaniclasticus]|uniref:lantibiotic immunity ABC transporter MutG family permease subunit n=1 Tax=Paenibacillus xylaniclasticus TaxID=588083 RepID=UPI000FD753A2|nr:MULTISPECIES: lantibiotic immunity ABC transporter MutG family permease subunit [Paenibacillus]GFN31385.1 multidrug ABC transporter permease [Paenibacillus curdlanolyticus]
MTMLRLMRSDWLKMKRTPLRWALLIAPVGYALLLLWYFSSFRVTPELQHKLYSAFLEGWTSLLPLVTGAVVGLICLQEEHAGRFSAVLGSPMSKAFIYINKIGMQITIHVVCMLLSAAILVLGMKYGLLIPSLDVNLFYKGALLAILGSLPLLVLHLWLSFAYGLGASVGIGGVGLLIAAIIGGTSAGDSLWPIMPWAWPVRLAMSPPDTVMLTKGLLPALLLFALLSIAGSIWFHQWEGRKHEE